MWMDADFSQVEYDNIRNRGVTQSVEFEKLLATYGKSEGSARIRIDGIDGQKAFQFRRERFGPLPSFYLGTSRELEITQDEANALIDELARKADTPTLIQLDSRNRIDLKGCVTYEIPQLVVDLEAELKPNKKRRQNIRKAEAHKLHVDVINQREIDECTKISAEFGKLRGIASPSRKLLQYASASPITKVFTVKSNDEMMGFEIALLDSELGIVYSWLAAWGNKAMETNAPSLLTWEIIKWSKSNGFRQFDFGGVDYSTQKKRNIAFFKESFGSTRAQSYSLRTITMRGLKMPFAYELVHFAYDNFYVHWHDK